uniref:Transposase Tc1-like domain-containing protein n=1 Tax=Seriola lalandi dorsalis TaxID=1841481 RepID=A0A3B4X3Q5_SERLL
MTNNWSRRCPVKTFTFVVYGKNGSAVSRPRRKPLLPKPHKTARLNFAKENERKPDKCWQHTVRSDENKMTEFGLDGVLHV